MTTDQLTSLAARAKAENGHYLVPSSDGRRQYRVTPLSCTCPDFEFRGRICKHRQAVSLLCEPRKEVAGDPFEGF